MNGDWRARMYRLVNRLVIYREWEKDNLLSAMADICCRFAKGNYEREELAGQVLMVVNRLLDVSTRYGFDGNLWHSYLAFLLAMTEAPFTLVCEKRGAAAGSIRSIAENDLSIFRQLWDYDFSLLEEALGLNVFSIVTDYRAVAKSEQIYNKSVSDKVRELTAAIGNAADGAAMFEVVTDFYARYGVGMLGLNKAFRVSPEIDVTDTLQAKVDGMSCYRTEKTVYPHPRSTEALFALGKYRGSNIGVELAEAFELLYEIN